jgi:hypothetical protein
MVRSDSSLDQYFLVCLAFPTFRTGYRREAVEMTYVCTVSFPCNENVLRQVTDMKGKEKREVMKKKKKKKTDAKTRNSFLSEVIRRQILADIPRASFLANSHITILSKGKGEDKVIPVLN